MTRPGGVWSNWARSHSTRPHRVEFPASTGAVQRSVRAAARRGLRIKAVGAGHSFAGIAVADDVLLDLTDLTGVVAADRETRQITLRAGTRLHQIPGLLAPYGLAMQNLGDIDRQSIAGATSTGTHGTGAAFGGLATQIVGVTLVTGDGEIVRIDQEQQPELLPAVAVGLGALGIIVEITLQCVPAFVLKGDDRREPLAEVVRDFETRMSEADHFEALWFPGTDVAHTRTSTRLPESAPRQRMSAASRWLSDEFLANGVWRAASAVGAAVPATAPKIARLAAAAAGTRTHTDTSARVFTQHRGVRFHEMEYAVPYEKLAGVFAAVRAEVAGRPWKVTYPVVVRRAAADELWMSTAYQRASGYIAVRRYFREDPTDYFAAMEEIFLAHDGRPHWGTVHNLAAEDLRAKYPRFDDFVALRDQWDPKRIFTNDYLDRVLGA